MIYDKEYIINYIMSLPRCGSSPDKYLDFTSIPDDAVFTSTSICPMDVVIDGYDSYDAYSRISRKCKCPLEQDYYKKVYSNPQIPPIVIVDGCVFDGNHRVSFCKQRNITTISAYIYKRI